MDYEALMDGRQKHVHEHFSPNSKLNDPEFVKKLLDWITFWRRNPSRFVQRYFGITLYLYQHIILYLMDIFPSICIVAARSAAKSFIIAVYACKEAILRPGSLIVVASATKKQARLIVSEKIAKEILPRSPLLQQEIKTIKDNQNDIEVKFNNGSSIVVLVANENVRGYRATVFIYEEFRMIVKSIIDTVLSPTLFQRQIPFRRVQRTERGTERNLYQLCMVQISLDVGLHEARDPRYVGQGQICSDWYGLQHRFEARD